MKFLIEHHDDTGDEIRQLNDPELNLLVASDSFSFFTAIAPDMLSREGIPPVVKKIRFMIEKMPEELRQLLAQQKIENPQIEAIKQQVLREFGI